MDALIAELDQEPTVEVAVRDAALSADVVTRPNDGKPANWTWENTPTGGNWGLERIRVPRTLESQCGHS